MVDDIANLHNFRISRVRGAAKSHSQRYPGARFDFRKMANELRNAAKYSRDLILSGKYYLNVYVAGGILEYNMVADALEKMAEE